MKEGLVHLTSGKIEFINLDTKELVNYNKLVN